MVVMFDRIRSDQLVLTPPPAILDDCLISLSLLEQISYNNYLYTFIGTIKLMMDIVIETKTMILW